MIVNSQGFGHFLQNINNQDFAYETPRMLLVLDGCSGAKYSEIGTRLFTQLFTRKEEHDSIEKFESNVKEVFDELIEVMRKYYPNPNDMENDFIMENLLFTIIACFDVGDKYVVKMFGDGYVVTQNICDKISYIKYSYGSCPPYFAYKYCKQLDYFKEYDFKTFEFEKKFFKNVGIASDGIQPIAVGQINIDDHIVKCEEAGLQFEIKKQKNIFGDDLTIALFDFKGERNEKI